MNTYSKQAKGERIQYVRAVVPPLLGTPQRLIKSVVLVAWSTLVIVTAMQLFVPLTLEQFALYPLLLGILFLGLPHGALDHLVPYRMGFGWAKRPVGNILFLLLYVSAAGLYYGLWLWRPGVAFGGFLAMSIWHWGQGDLRFLELFLGRAQSNWAGSLTTILLRGALPIVTPVLVFPETATSLYAHITAGLGVQAAPLDLHSFALRASLIGGLLLLFGGYFANAVRVAPNRNVLAVDCFELLLLVVLFTVVPAYAAIGVYFIFWHSLRHLTRLLLLRPQDVISVCRGAWQRPLRQLTFDLLPITLVAVATLVGLYLWNAPRVTSLEGFIALYLTLISALTLPHLLVVALMDTKKEAVVKT